MNKEQLIKSLVDQFEGDPKKAAHAVDTVIDGIMRAVVDGEDVQITPFGKFTRRSRPLRRVRNPQTGNYFLAPPENYPFFKAGAAFRELCDGKRPVTDRPLSVKFYA